MTIHKQKAADLTINRLMFRYCTSASPKDRACHLGPFHKGM